MRPVRAVIFDMDGVVVDSESRHELAFLETVAEIGYADRHGIHYPDYVGRSDLELWVDFLKRHQPGHTLEELLAMKRQRVVNIILRDQPLFPGLPELIAQLAACYPLGLASGSERQVVDAVLQLRNLRRFFSVTVSCSEVKHGKPAPDIFLHAAQLLGVPPAECCVIEDSTAGVAAGLAAGMEVIAITNTYPAPELAPAQHVVSRYPQIAQLLLNSK
ncbi:MAG TPA: HAD family phosphatase [Clostridia bacterium]|nr:HAD family phosphatase [Clostridia bacterium]